MNVKISRTNDPFKKYWWVILVVFGLVGAVMCMPGGGTGSGDVAGGEKGFSGSGEQSLDSANNPNGAPGGAVNLSMDGSGPYRKNDGGLTSSLYQAPGDAVVASSAASASAGGGNLATALKMVASKSARSGSASVDTGGWGGEKAQKGFTAPLKTNFASMSNVAGSGGGVSASFSGGGEGVSAFGTGKANTGVDFAKGLGGGASEDGLMKNASASMRSLNGAANNAISAAGQKSNDLASAMGGRSFDGSNSRSTGSGRGGGGAGGDAGAVALGGAGAYAKLDSAPANLKANPTTLDQKQIAPPAVTPTPPAPPSMMQMIMQMVMVGLVGAVMQGIVGAMI